MDLADIDPSLRPALKSVPRVPMYRPFVRRLVRLLDRIGVTKTPCDPSVSYEDIAIPNASIRVYSPPGKPSGVGLIWIHGGGLIVGKPAQDNRLCSRYAKELNAVVVSVDYRLAPENPFPAAQDDCLTAWDWLQENAQQYGVNPERVVIAGQSGGGCLAASLCQRIAADEQRIQPIAQLLWCPMLDDRTGANEALDDIKHLMWDNLNNRAAWSWYLGEHFAAESVPPFAVPARHDPLSNLPPTWIGIGDVDLFYQESMAYADRLKAAGVPCETDIVAAAPHAFEVIAHKTQLAKDYMERHFKFVQNLLDGDRSA